MHFEISNEHYKIIMNCLQKKQIKPDYDVKQRVEVAIVLRHQLEINKEIENEMEPVWEDKDEVVCKRCKKNPPLELMSFWNEEKKEVYQEFFCNDCKMIVPVELRLKEVK